MLNYLKQSTYETLKSETFPLKLDDDNSLDLVLANVYDGIPPSDKYESFKIELQGPPDFLLRQRIYEFNHEKIGIFQLFIVPVMQNEQGFLYEAVFNVLKEDG